MRPTASYWYHGTCGIHHRTQDAANRCTNRVPAPAAAYATAAAAPRRKTTPGQRVIIGCVAVVIGIVATIYDANRPHSKAVTRSTYSSTDPWPLTVDSGTLTCESGSVLFTAGGVVYAQYPVPGDGHVDIDRITADVPGLQGEKMSVYSLFAEGAMLC